MKQCAATYRMAKKVSRYRIIKQIALRAGCMNVTSIKPLRVYLSAECDDFFVIHCHSITWASAASDGFRF